MGANSNNTNLSVASSRRRENDKKSRTTEGADTNTAGEHPWTISDHNAAGQISVGSRSEHDEKDMAHTADEQPYILSDGYCKRMEGALRSISIESWLETNKKDTVVGVSQQQISVESWSENHKNDTTVGVSQRQISIESWSENYKK